MIIPGIYVEDNMFSHIFFHDKKGTERRCLNCSIHVETSAFQLSSAAYSNNNSWYLCALCIFA